MTDVHDSAHANRTATLVVERVIRASAQRLFEAWTRPELLRQWWGPKDVICTRAEIDLRVDGRYRIDNLLPNGEMLSIVGEYERVDSPRELVFNWRLQPAPKGDQVVSERVTVRFEALDEGTRVTVIHERIPSDVVRDDHRRGWEGCLDGLARNVA